MAWILDIPNWAIYALVGAVLGGIFALVGFGLERIGFKGGRFLVVFAFAVTPIVTENAVFPLIEPTIMCETARRAASEIERGFELDEYTRVESMTANCGSRSIVYDLTAHSLISSDVSPEGWQAIASEFNSAQCGTGGWRYFIDAGWAVTNRYTFADGFQRHLVASCA